MPEEWQTANTSPILKKKTTSQNVEIIDESPY
jgi:hypothetical protein